jgi:hypothetical protein
MTGGSFVRTPVPIIPTGCRFIQPRLAGQVYPFGRPIIRMKKPAEQKTKGHKAKDNPASTFPARASEPLSKEQITSLRDKSAAKKKGRKH